jgi:hypothetical protein
MGEPIHQQRCEAGACGVAINQPAGRGLQASATQCSLLTKVANALGQSKAIAEVDAHGSTPSSAGREAVCENGTQLAFWLLLMRGLFLCPVAVNCSGMESSD